ncbi:MAG: GDP-fucose synthetase [Candidatus Liptonbacteria bacterium RIFCSPLOWO2_01_FULL_52_25]|uniref:GDP-L-fucose synthase n=1 Tax=Candidatus Liptonbacteria bacterium RIFCSPLOWO2_01_FULL_52_25 TaxID=1798650 RepID=A0A1G2CHH9_9BACT|nr:MAG: GDP-fucose synthetase [Candidatus Liptonbacteria bacterium RIFCSPLOWO2_01_FULL_52_25]
MEKNSRIYVAGHRGLVGSAILRKLQADGYTKLITKTREELDLLDFAATKEFFKNTKPEYVFDAAAKVGGILANDTYPAEFISENLAIQNNIIRNCHAGGVKKLLFLGSSCVYPRACPQPIKEEYLLTSELEPTNKAYAVAKIAGIIECQSYNRQYGTNFISVMPTNVYGANDNFDPKTSHVLAALVRKFHEAKSSGSDEVRLWGTGAPRRELLNTDDLADACVFVMNKEDAPDILNIGTGMDLTVKEIAELIKKISGFKGTIKWDASKPDGTPRKLLDVSRIHALGWRHKIDLEEGAKMLYDYFVENVAKKS